MENPTDFQGYWESNWFQASDVRNPSRDLSEYEQFEIIGCKISLWQYTARTCPSIFLLSRMNCHISVANAYTLLESLCNKHILHSRGIVDQLFDMTQTGTETSTFSGMACVTYNKECRWPVFISGLLKNDWVH